jgi:hypothetical protein
VKLIRTNRYDEGTQALLGASRPRPRVSVGASGSDEGFPTSIFAIIIAAGVAWGLISSKFEKAAR